MKVLKPGYAYRLANFEIPDEGQTIRFIDKAPNKETGKFETVYDGTTNEEVLEMLIDRLTFLDHIMQHENNKVAIVLLKTALQALNERTADRESRGVEGTAKP